MLLNLLYILFILSCLYDPANKLFGLKFPVFIVLMLYTVLSPKSHYPKSVTRYVLTFSLILPVLSVIWGMISNGNAYKDDSILEIIKPYLFIFLVYSLVNAQKLDIYKIFAYCLLILSFTIIVLFFSYTTGLIPFDLLFAFGMEYDMFAVGERQFAALTIDRVYFHTSPMLVFGSFYFYDLYYRSFKKKFLFLSLIVSFSLILSGTRNDMIMAFSPYLFYGYIRASKLQKVYILFLFVGIVSYFISADVLTQFFSKDDGSNEQKISYIPLYMERFSNPLSFIMGEGLGSYFIIPVRGLVNNSELTYFELFRRFGLFMGIYMLFLMFKPVLVLCKKKDNQWLGLAYLMYLIMIFSNPFFFSSNGMLILSIVILTIYKSGDSVFLRHHKVC